MFLNHPNHKLCFVCYSIKQVIGKNVVFLSLTKKGVYRGFFFILLGDTLWMK